MGTWFGACGFEVFADCQEVVPEALAVLGHLMKADSGSFHR